MPRTFALLSTLLLAAPMALAQTPAPQTAPGDPAAVPPPPPPGITARHNGPDREGRRGPGRGPEERDGRPGRGPGRGPEDGGPDGMAGMHFPPGTWWRNPEVVSRLSLSQDQVKRIDSIFLESRVQLIHMHASLEEEQLRLEPLLSATPFNQQNALAQISKIADTRAELEKTNARMLLSIRGVLSGDQWTKLQQRPMGPRGMDAGGPDLHRPGGLGDGYRRSGALDGPPPPAGE